MSSNQDKINELISFREQAKMGGGQKRIDSQHKKGKLTARERIEMLLDEGSFEEFDMFVKHRCTNFGIDKESYFGDGVVTGYGTIDGRLVYVFSQGLHRLRRFAFRNLRSQNLQGHGHGNEKRRAADRHQRLGRSAYPGGCQQPFRLHRDLPAQHPRLGVIPQISAIFGPCAGGAVYSPALTDFIMMNQGTSYMFVTGPKVVKTVTGEEVNQEQLGGASVHAAKSGVAHFVVDNEEDGIKTLRKLLSYLPSNNLEEAPMMACNDAIDRLEDTLNEIIPDNPNKPYDVLEVIRAIVDNRDFFECQKLFAQNIVTGFARFNGQSVGIIANQPKYMAGVLDINASRKAARFVRFCDAFNIPIVTLVDVPGFLPGTGQEYGGIIIHGAKLLFAYGEATVPKVTVILRKAYGGAYCVMSSKHLRGDINYAWPTGEIAVMGPKGAIEVLSSKEIAAIEDDSKKPSSSPKKKPTTAINSQIRTSLHSTAISTT